MPETVFDEVLGEVQKHTVISGRILRLLWQACQKVKDLPGSVAECGVFRGGSLRLIAKALPAKQIWGFDTFSGMPVARDFDKIVLGAFDQTSVEEVTKYLCDIGNVSLIKGVFPASFEFLPEDERFCLLHLDCDQYDSYHAALDFFLPRLVEGGIIVIDDYELEGARRAINERFPDIARPPYMVRMTAKNFETMEVRPHA